MLRPFMGGIGGLLFRRRRRRERRVMGWPRGMLGDGWVVWERC
jgi:hypothetical protein